MKIFDLIHQLSFDLDDEIHDDQEGFIGTRAYHRNTGRK
jgi:hypothetical protein